MKSVISEGRFELDQPFNNFPGMSVISQDIASLKKDIDLVMEIVDLDTKHSNFWENDRATLVIAIDKDQIAYWSVLKEKWQADEMHTKVVEGKTILRLWWD